MTAERYLTVTIFDAPPVRLLPRDWPIIANVSDEDTTAGDWVLQLIVRRNAADGRHLVSAIARPRTYAMATARRAAQQRGGMVVSDRPGEPDVVAGIKAVAARMEFDDELAQRCIAALPAVAI